MPSDIQPKSFVDKDFSVIVKNFCLFEKLRKLNKFPELAIASHLPGLAYGLVGDRTNTLLMLNFYDFLLLHTVIIHPSSICDRKVCVKFWG